MWTSLRGQQEERSCKPYRNDKKIRVLPMACLPLGQIACRSPDAVWWPPKYHLPFAVFPYLPREQISIFSSTLSPHCAPHHDLSGTPTHICLFPRQDVVMNYFLDELTREIRTGKWGHPELKCRCQGTMIQNHSLPVYLQTNHISSFSFVIRKKKFCFTGLLLKN